ncbi:MAG: FG-GAP repeat protein [Flavobacteriales bacterium]|nr:FG-GAP repeat protein [Flavobacteriales bacterium]
MRPAYIFKRNGDVWIEQQKIVANDRATLDEFGWSVAISGDHVIVGARTRITMRWAVVNWTTPVQRTSSCGTVTAGCSKPS